MVVGYWNSSLYDRAGAILLVGSDSLTSLLYGERGWVDVPSQYQPGGGQHTAGYRRFMGWFARAYNQALWSCRGLETRSFEVFHKAHVENQHPNRGFRLTPEGHFKQPQARGAVPKAQATPENMVSLADGEQDDLAHSRWHRKGADAGRQTVRDAEGAVQRSQGLIAFPFQ